MDSKPLVYSYTRFSSPDQSLGDSERRQIEAAQTFAQSKGLKLDDKLTMIDRGLSGFHGKHRSKGCFGAFLQKVDSGEVPPGSILLVENIDRLSREPLTTALSTVLDLLNHGITIETLSPPDTFNTESVNNGAFWRLGAHIDRAHAESKRKSDLLKAAWRQKRALAGKGCWLTGRAPAWFRVVSYKVNDRVVRHDVTPIPEAVETVKRIFTLRLEGFSKAAIEKKLNAEATWTPPKVSEKRGGNGWRKSYIEKILNNRAVIGEFQAYRRQDGKRVAEGDPIPDYYPAVITADTFHAVQRLQKATKGKGGRTGTVANLFPHLVRCGYCGGPMIYLNKGEAPKGGAYLACDYGRRRLYDSDGKRKCSIHQVRYDEFQETVLSNLLRLQPETVLPKEDDRAQRTKRLRTALSGVTAQLTEVTSQIENFIDQIGLTKNSTIRTRYEQKVEELERKKENLNTEKAQKEAALRELERGEQDFAKWQADLGGLKNAVARDVDTRVRLRAHLTELISRIDVFGKGHAETVEEAEAVLDDFLPDLPRAKSYPLFRRYMRRRLISPDGRFYRVWIKTSRLSNGVALAPESSLAAHLTLAPSTKRGAYKGTWKFAPPKLGVLLDEFFDKRRPGFQPKGSALKRLGRADCPGITKK